MRMSTRKRASARASNDLLAGGGKDGRGRTIRTFEKLPSPSPRNNAAYLLVESHRMSGTRALALAGWQAKRHRDLQTARVRRAPEHLHPRRRRKQHTRGFASLTPLFETRISTKPSHSSSPNNTHTSNNTANAKLQWECRKNDTCVLERERFTICLSGVLSRSARDELACCFFMHTQLPAANSMPDILSDFFLETGQSETSHSRHQCQPKHSVCTWRNSL